jgi:hypothetical protein
VPTQGSSSSVCRQLVNSWEHDALPTPVGVGDAGAPTRPAPLDGAAAITRAAPPLDDSGAAANSPSLDAPALASASTQAWQRVARSLGHAVQQALPAHDGANQDLARELGALVQRMEAGPRSRRSAPTPTCSRAGSSACCSIAITSSTSSASSATS